MCRKAQKKYYDFVLFELIYAFLCFIPFINYKWWTKWKWLNSSKCFIAIKTNKYQIIITVTRILIFLIPAPLTSPLTSPLSFFSSSESELSERRHVETFLSLVLTNLLLLLLPAVVLLTESPEWDTDWEEEQDLDLDLELDILDRGEELRDLDLMELRDLDLDLSESESKLDNLDCLLEILMVELVKYKTMQK